MTKMREVGEERRIIEKQDTTCEEVALQVEICISMEMSGGKAKAGC